MKRVVSLSSSEKWEEAEIILDKLIMAKPWDAAILLSKANLKKKAWIASGCENSTALAETLQLFSRCHLLTGSIEAGINFSTLLLINGKATEAYARADDLAQHCRLSILDNDIQKLDNYAVVIAEIHLLKGNWQAAETWYKTVSLENKSTIPHVKENMNLLLNHLRPEQEMVTRIRDSVETYHR